MSRLNGKVALITGGAGGIGRETAILFAKEGASVVVTDVNDAGGQQTVSTITDNAGNAIYIHADVSQAAACKGMVDLAESEYGGLDILFNNAGIMHSDDGNAMQTSEDVWDLTMNINLKGVY